MSTPTPPSPADRPRIAVIIPALNEEASLPLVLRAIPSDWVEEVVVGDNGSTDRTAEVARKEGATVVTAPRRGYGTACLAAMDYLQRLPLEKQPEIVVFLDGDYSDYPEELPKVVEPILKGGMDMVIGSRALGEMETGAMQPQQLFGNWLSTRLIKWLYGYHFTDLGPFRAIRYDRLMEMGMEDPDFGWTVEMQVRAAKRKLQCTEVPVNYRRRIGESKVSGTIKGSILAGHKILWTLFKLW